MAKRKTIQFERTSDVEEALEKLIKYMPITGSLSASSKAVYLIGLGCRYIDFVSLSQQDDGSHQGVTANPAKNAAIDESEIATAVSGQCKEPELAAEPVSGDPFLDEDY